MMKLFSRLSIAGRIGAVLVTGMLAVALMSLVWTPYDPNHVMPGERLAGMSIAHPLGTDRFGRDVLSRIMAGAQITVFVGVLAVSLSALAGVPLGIVAGMRRGLVESLVGRLNDLLLAFPALLGAIVAAAVFGPSTAVAVIAIGVAGIPAFARLARAGTLQVMSQDYVRAARLARRPAWDIAMRHVLPNIAGLLIVQASVAFALAILAEAGLSFLGLGTPPPDPSWGRMLQSAQASLGSAPQLALWPGLAIALTVLGCNLLGDALRDVFDPTLSRRRGRS